MIDNPWLKCYKMNRCVFTFELFCWNKLCHFNVWKWPDNLMCYMRKRYLLSPNLKKQAMLLSCCHLWPFCFPFSPGVAWLTCTLSGGLDNNNNWFDNTLVVGKITRTTTKQEPRSTQTFSKEACHLVRSQLRLRLIVSDFFCLIWSPGMLYSTVHWNTESLSALLGCM